MSQQFFQNESQFIPAYRDFCQDRGKVPDLNFRIDNRSVRLFRLWQVVSEVGGGEEVSAALLWHGLAEELLGSSENNSVNAKSLKEIYYSRLLGFELELKQEKEEAAKQANVPCFVPQPKPSDITYMVSQASFETALDPRPKKTKKDKRKKKKSKSDRFALIPTATIVHAKLNRTNSGDTTDAEPAHIFRPISFSPRPESVDGDGQSLPAPKPVSTQYYEPPTELQKPAKHAQNGSTKPNGSKAQAKEPKQNPPRPHLNPSQATNAMLASGFQPLMVSHEHMRQQPTVSMGPQIRPMLDPFAGQANNSRFRARMAAIAAKHARRDAPFRQPSPLGPSLIPKDVLLAKSGFMPLSNPSGDALPEKSFKESPKSGRHVNRHTMLTANCNTRAHIPMLEVLAELELAAAEAETPAKKKQKISKSKMAEKIVADTLPKKGKAFAVPDDADPENTASGRSSPFSLECHENHNSEASEEQVPLARVKRRGRPPLSSQAKPAHNVKIRKPTPTKRPRGRPVGSTKIAIQAHALQKATDLQSQPNLQQTDARQHRRTHKKGSAALHAFQQELIQPETVVGLVSELRRAARSFTFPAASSQKPACKKSPEKLDHEPLCAVSGHMKTSLNPLIGTASPAMSRESSPAIPQLDLSKTGKVELSNTQTRFMAHVRGEHWLEEPQESIFPKEPIPVTAAVAPGIGRRSTRQRNAPVTFSPNFAGTYDRRPQEAPPYSPGMPVGQDFQATLPECAPKPKKGSQIPQQESKWLCNVVNRPGDFGNAERPAPVLMVPPDTPDAPLRYSCGNGANTLLDAARILDMGLSEMGSLSMHDWTPEDVMLFEQGLNENRRDFAGIAKKFLPHKGSLKVCSFYYNLWKSRVIPEARLWYQRRDEAKRRAAEEKLGAEESKKQSAQQHQPTAAELKASEARMLFMALKEPLAWIKSAARQPHKQDWGTYSRLDLIYKARERLTTANVNTLMANGKAQRLGTPIQNTQHSAPVPRAIVKLAAGTNQMVGKGGMTPGKRSATPSSSQPIVLAPLPKLLIRNSNSLVPAKH